MSYLKLATRILIGGLFLFSGWQKFAIPIENFQEVLRVYSIFPEFSILFLSYFVPAAEIIMGAMLVAGFLTRLALVGSWIFFGTFIFVISRALVLKIPLIDCGCFGKALSLPPAFDLGLDIGFLFLTTWLLFSKPSPLSLDRLLFRSK
jgi:uncharacterized membrane protein YphA (DoxX/SURF4 family)